MVVDSERRTYTDTPRAIYLYGPAYIAAKQRAERRRRQQQQQYGRMCVVYCGPFARKRWMGFVSIPFSSLYSCRFCARLFSLAHSLTLQPPMLACLFRKYCVPSARETETRGICANPSAQYTFQWYEHQPTDVECDTKWHSVEFGRQMNMVDGRDAFYWMRGQNTYVVYFILCIPICTRRYTICAALWNDDDDENNESTESTVNIRRSFVPTIIK